MRRNSHRLPRGYFADAPTHFAAPENLGQTSGTEVSADREAVGGSGAASTFGARTTQERSSNTQHVATNATPCAAPTLSGASQGAGFGVTAGVGLSSAPAYLNDNDRDRLKRLRAVLGP